MRGCGVLGFVVMVILFFVFKMISMHTNTPYVVVVLVGIGAFTLFSIFVALIAKVFGLGKQSKTTEPISNSSSIELKAQEGLTRENDAEIGASTLPSREIINGKEHVFFVCPNCAARISFRSKYIGMMERCPKCNERLMIPEA